MSADTGRLRRAIFGECRRRGIDDAARHALQERVIGVPSLRGASDEQLRQVLREIRAPRRRVPAAKPPKQAAPKTQADLLLPDGPHRAKLRALWICGWELGVMDNPTDAALAAWICRQTKLDAARWATPTHTAQCIEALKDWLARDAGVSWRGYAQLGKSRPKYIPRARVLEALWRRLHAAGAVTTPDASMLSAWITKTRGDPQDYVHLDAPEQDRLIRKLGAWLRRVSE